jgi:hypothetical protein
MLMNSYGIHRFRQEQKKDMLRQAARWRLLRDAGLLWGTQARQSACRMLCWLGRALVALGEQLEQVGQLRPAAQ